MKDLNNSDNSSSNKKEVNNVARRIKINGRYYIIRERSTSIGKKGTIQGKWKPLRKSRSKSIFDLFK